MNELTAAVDALEQTWRSTAAVCRELSDADWDKPTRCPGWSVKDQLSHLVGLERVLMGGPHPDHQPPDAAHIRDDVGRYMEVHVDVRRSVPPQEVLDEFEAMLEERIPQLREIAEAGDPEAPMAGPMGFGSKASSMLPIRVLDSWVHEQDIRHAVDKPGGYDSSAAQVVVDRFVAGLGMIVGKRAQAPEGAAVTFVIEGPIARTLTVRVKDGRAEVAEDGVTPVANTVLQMSTETFVALLAGREGAADGVKIEGDEDLGRRIVDNAAVTP